MPLTVTCHGLFARWGHSGEPDRRFPAMWSSHSDEDRETGKRRIKNSTQGYEYWRVMRTEYSRQRDSSCQSPAATMR